MPTQLFALILEDNLADFELIAHELARFGFDALCKRVETEADYTERLREMPDIVLASYSLIGFDNLRALEILHQSGLVIPFIVLTGTFGEDQVVECMQKGATDYLLKERILRLGPAGEGAPGGGGRRRPENAG